MNEEINRASLADRLVDMATLANSRCMEPGIIVASGISHRDGRIEAQLWKPDEIGLVGQNHQPFVNRAASTGLDLVEPGSSDISNRPDLAPPDGADHRVRKVRSPGRLPRQGAGIFLIGSTSELDMNHASVPFDLEGRLSPQNQALCQIEAALVAPAPRGAAQTV